MLLTSQNVEKQFWTFLGQNETSMSLCQKETSPNYLRFLQSSHAKSMIWREVGVMQQHVDVAVCVVAVLEELH